MFWLCQRRSFRLTANGAESSKGWRKHGALEYFECVGDDLNTKWAGIKFREQSRLSPARQ